MLRRRDRVAGAVDLLAGQWPLSYTCSKRKGAKTEEECEVKVAQKGSSTMDIPLTQNDQTRGPRACQQKRTRTPTASRSTRHRPSNSCEADAPGSTQLSHQKSWRSREWERRWQSHQQRRATLEGHRLAADRSRGKDQVRILSLGLPRY